MATQKPCTRREAGSKASKGRTRVEALLKTSAKDRIMAEENERPQTNQNKHSNAKGDSGKIAEDAEKAEREGTGRKTWRHDLVSIETWPWRQ